MRRTGEDVFKNRVLHSEYQLSPHPPLRGPPSPKGKAWVYSHRTSSVRHPELVELLDEGTCEFIQKQEP